MIPHLQMPRKAVIALGFGGEKTGQEAAAPALPYGALAERLPAADRQDIQHAVEEALSAGLMELVFITRDGITLAAGDGEPREVVLARAPGTRDLAAALRAARPLIGGEPFVVLAPEALPRDGANVTEQLLAAYRRYGGNLAIVADDRLLQRDGTFAAIAAARGAFLLQPEVLDALDAGAGLAETLLDMAEAWPVTAVPLAGNDNPASALAIAGAAD